MIITKAKIYGLVDPTNNNVFYIGASTRPLEKVLYTQIMDVKHGNVGIKPKTEKFLLFKHLAEQGLKPDIFQIDEVLISEVKFFHKFYVDLYISYGFKIFIDHRVNYSESYFTKKNSRPRPIKSSFEKRKLASNYRKNKINTCKIFKFKALTRNLIYNSFRRGCQGIYKKSAKTEQILGCSLEDFMIHIASKFKGDMTFDNYGLWHLDHIVPLASAKTEDDIILLNNYTNFQPLWAFDNRIKHSKVFSAAGATVVQEKVWEVNNGVGTDL